MTFVRGAKKRSGPLSSAGAKIAGVVPSSFVRGFGGSVLRGILLGLCAIVLLGRVHAATAPVELPRYALSDNDNTFLTDLEQRGVRYFVENCDPYTGLARDRAPADGSASTAPASIAATGFALTAWCIADSRGWLAPGVAEYHVQHTLRFIADHYPQEHGWFYHFADAHTGVRAWHCEASTIDTALFLQGAVLAREYLRDHETTELVNRIYGRIDWQWAMNGGPTLTHGWRPEGGFLPYRWDSYSELMGMYLLGLGAPKQELPATAWDAFRRPTVQFQGRNFIQCGPLFTHQYAEGWFDFRGLRDAHADYWKNSVDATLAQRDWAASQSTRFHHWSSDMWGLTASDGPHGYMGWGTPNSPAQDQSDGTLVPCAPGGSLPFAPRECLAALQQMRTVGGNSLYGRYGFADAFNPETGWTSSSVIGIDVGITLVMAENLRTGLVWNNFMHAPEVQRAMARAGFAPEKPGKPSAFPTRAFAWVSSHLKSLAMIALPHKN